MFNSFSSDTILFMNYIQTKLLDIAKIYIDICDKLNLRYFAVGGTCLGAIRDGGFIPWDDDIDFAMPRPDFDKFVRLAQPLLPSNYFLQTHDTDKNFFCPFAKLRDSSTTAIEDSVKNIFINHGLWIDIFPLDGLPDSLRKRKKLELLDKKILRRRYLPFAYRFRDVAFGGKILNVLCAIFLPSRELAYRINLKNSLKYPFSESKFCWWNWGNRIKRSFLREWFDSCKRVKFEDIFINVPYYYGSYLKHHFGNWNEYPPIEQRKSCHHFYIVDLDKPYTEYYRNNKLLKNK